MEEEKGTYFVEVKCPNCGWEGTVEIEKGIPIAETPCPNCGVLLGKIEEAGEEEV